MHKKEHDTICFLPICADQVLKTALSLYMEDKTLPLPTFEEILICTPSTTSEEVRLIAICRTTVFISSPTTHIHT